MRTMDDIYQKELPFIIPKTIEECNRELQESGRYGPLKICLGDMSISDTESYLLSKAVALSKHLTHFFLVHTRLTEGILESILNGLKKCRTLYHLDLSHCRIRDAGAQHVANFIKKNRCVSILNLDNNRITTRGAEDLAVGLEFNKYLSILTLANNRLDKTVVRPFLSALKINRILYVLDLGKIQSIRLKSALRNNELFRAVTFDSVLSKPRLSKTKFGFCKVSVIGESNCGKSMFIQGLLTNEPVSKGELRKGSMNTFNGDSGTSENFPQIKIRNIRTTSKLEFWQEVQKHENFLTEHAMRTAHLLLIRQMKQAEKSRKTVEVEEEAPLKKKKSFSQISLRRKKSDSASSEHNSPKMSLAKSLSLRRLRKKSVSEESSSDSSGTESDNESEEPIKKLTMHTLASFKTMGTLRRTQVSKESTDQRTNSAFSGMSAFDDNEVIALGRGTQYSVSTATTKESGSSDEGKKKMSMMQEVKLKQSSTKESSPKLSDRVIEVDYDSEDEFEEVVDIEEYVENQENKYDFPVEGEYEPIAEYKPFLKLQEKYNRRAAKQAKIDEVSGKRLTLTMANPRKKSGPDLDSNLRAFSIASRRQSAYSSVSGSQNGDRRKTLGGGELLQRRSRLVEHKANEHMRRHFSENVFMKVKSRQEGLDLAVWELSDNNKNDAMFTGLYNIFLSQEGYGLTIICFDLNRLVPTANNKSLGRKALVYYLKVAKTKGDAKILLVGTKLDRIKKLQKLSLINTEVKKALKEAKITRILVNSQSKLLYYPVDIVKNYGIPELRKKIEKVCAKLDHVKRHLSLRDMSFLDYLTADKFNEDKSLRSTIDFKEVLFWSEALSLERIRVESLLRLFTRQGLTFFFPNLRSIQEQIVYRVSPCIEAICDVFNVESLNSSYNALYNNKGLEVARNIEHVNGYSKNFLLSRPMIDHICGDRGDSEYITNFLQEKLLLCDWIFDPELFYRDINVQNNIEPRHLDADILILPTLLNDRTVINNFAKLKNKRMTGITDLQQEDEILGEAEKYEIFYEALDRTMFPSGFFACYVSAFISYLTKLKMRFDKMHNFDKSAKHALTKASIEIFNTTSAPTVKIIINSEFGFYIRGSRTGIRVFIHPKRKAGAFASFRFAHGMVDKVNKDILGVNWNFAIKIRVKGKFKSLRKLTENASKLQDVFSEFVGVSTFKVGKGMSGIENYFRTGQR